MTSVVLFKLEENLLKVFVHNELGGIGKEGESKGQFLKPNKSCTPILWPCAAWLVFETRSLGLGVENYDFHMVLTTDESNIY